MNTSLPTHACLVSLLILSNIVLAAPPAKGVNALKNESPAVLGIDLNKPFPGNMLACPLHTLTHIVDQQEMEKSTETCFFQRESNYFDLHKTPDLGIGNTVSLRTYDGYPAVFLLITDGSRFNQMESVFVDRYGKATSTSKSTVKNGLGQSFESRTLMWNGKFLTIRLDSRGQRLDQSQALITSIQAAKKRDADYKDAASRASGKL